VQKAAAALVAQPVAVTPDRDHLAVMQSPIEDGGGRHSIAKHLLCAAEGFWAEWRS